MVPSPIEDDVETFIALVSEAIGDGRLEIRLFGSWARNRAFAGSNIDLAVISDAFNGIPWNARVRMLAGVAQKLPRIACVGITFDELVDYDYPSIIRSVRGQDAKIIYERKEHGVTLMKTIKFDPEKINRR
jgi:predicted nucleotidyltransferase